MSKNWSTQQIAIFSHFATGRGHLVVRARAGTGKTTTILEAINHAPESKVLLAAFNGRIAKELQEKLGGWSFGARAEAKTLHSLGFSFVKYAFGKDIQPDDEVEGMRIREVVGSQAPDGVEGIVAKLVTRAKNALPFAATSQICEVADQLDLLPSYDQEREGWTIEHIAHKVVAVLDASKTIRPDRKISFDDQVWLPVVLRLARPWYQLVVIDEAQDMNACQLLLARAACKKTGRIVVVGDDRQAIYGFRGADSGSIDRLKAELCAAEMGLTTTYRCGKTIVAKAQQLVPDYQAHETAPDGVVDAATYEEAVAAARPGDFVLSRKNAPLMSTCLRLLRQGVAARVEGRDVGKGLANVIKKFRAKSVPDFLKRLTAWQTKETVRIEAKGKNVDEKLQVVNDQFETLSALADGAANVQEIVDRCFNLFEDSIDQKGKPNLKPAVVCSSVHKAKGLEADRVFVLVDTLSRRDNEELNIQYVAYTRAKQHLTLVSGLPGQKAK